MKSFKMRELYRFQTVNFNGLKLCLNLLSSFIHEMNELNYYLIC